VRPVRLELSGFLSYSERTCVELDGLDAAAIVGENGAGKTSIVEAMGWALFGKGRAKSPDDYVSVGSTECRVSFEFLLRDRRYRALRERALTSGGKSYLGLFVQSVPMSYPDPRIGSRPDQFGPDATLTTKGGEWIPIGGDRIEETQREIEELLGLDYDTWLTTSFVGQNRADQFTRLTPAGRKELLGEVLQLDVYARLHEEAQARARTFAGEMVAAQRRLEDLEDVLAGEGEARRRVAVAVGGGELAEAAVARAQDELGGARKSLDLARDRVASVARMADQLASLRARRQESADRLHRRLSELAEQRRQAEAEAERAKGVLQEISSASARATDLEGQAIVKQRDVDELLEAAVDLRARARLHTEEQTKELAFIQTVAEQLYELKDRLATLEHATEATCPTCGRELDPDSRTEIVIHLKDEMRRLNEQAMERRRRADGQAEQARQLLETADAKDKEVRALEAEVHQLRREADRASAAAERIPLEETRLRGFEQTAEQLAAREQAVLLELSQLEQGPNAEETRLQEAIDAGAPFGEQVATLGQELQRLEGTLQEARSRALAAAGERGRAEEALEAILRAHKDHQATKEELARTSELRWGYETLAAAFGRDGIPALIVENAIPEIEEEANRFLEKVTAGRYTVRLDSLKATKAGSIRESLEVLVADGVSERSLESLSGAERQCVDLSLRIGLARLLARRSGRPIGTLILDEPFTALDPAHLQATIEALHVLREEFPTLLVVTHQLALANAFSTRILITREGDGPSRVEIAA
jgi:exonuclease SbcC